VINAGGIVAFYPSKEPLQHQAQFLNGRDLYGELTRAAHADGLIVFARDPGQQVRGPGVIRQTSRQLAGGNKVRVAVPQLLPLESSPPSANSLH